MSTFLAAVKREWSGMFQQQSVFCTARLLNRQAEELSRFLEAFRNSVHLGPPGAAKGGLQ